jgi:hypothetical protein
MVKLFMVVDDDVPEERLSSIYPVSLAAAIEAFGPFYVLFLDLDVISYCIILCYDFWMI